MKKPAYELTVLLIMLALLAGGRLLQRAVAGSGLPHLERAECADCHLGGRNVTAAQAGMLTAGQEALCGKCHAAALKASHPSGFAPKSKPPDIYPLDWKGDLTCSTCHEVHGRKPGLLRGARQGRELCLACHDADFFKKMRDGGASLMAGHLSKGVDGAPTLDAFSRQCMECHGQSGDPRLATLVDRNGVVRHASRSVNHPIGVNYQKAAGFGGYRPRKAVERTLFLPDGMISCVSCHHGYRKEHGKLVVANAGSKLCYECHDL